MASIEVIIRDDDGNIISQKPAKQVNLKQANLGDFWKRPYRLKYCPSASLRAKSLAD